MTVTCTILFTKDTWEKIKNLSSDLDMTCSDTVQKLFEDGLKESDVSSEVLKEQIKLRNKYVSEFHEALKNQHSKQAHELYIKVGTMCEAVDIAIEIIAGRRRKA